MHKDYSRMYNFKKGIVNLKKPTKRDQVTANL